jgi:hypothetical protein
MTRFAGSQAERRAAEHLDECPECAAEFRACLAALTEDGAG